MDKSFVPLKGHCTCRAIKYQVLAPFLCVNCCHCTWCQRETGTAFVLNGIIESSNFNIISEVKPLLINAPSASGKGQMFARCPKCYTVLYSDYDGDGTWTKFVRTGTLDEESKKSARPTVHIHTSTKLDWMDLSGEEDKGVPVMKEHYRRIEVWNKEANERFEALKLRMDGAQKGG